MNAHPPSNTPQHAPGEDEDTLQALWKCQEHALRGLREGLSSATDADATGADSVHGHTMRIDASDADPGAATYRALFAALAREPLPELPADFAQRTAVAAERSAQARRDVARFRKRLSGWLGLLYLPAMLVVAAMYIPKLWRAAPPLASGEVSLGGWLIAIAVLWTLSLAIDHWWVDGVDDTH
jgi:hypothetical protein